VARCRGLNNDEILNLLQELDDTDLSALIDDDDDDPLFHYENILNPINDASVIISIGDNEPDPPEETSDTLTTNM